MIPDSEGLTPKFDIYRWCMWDNMFRLQFSKNKASSREQIREVAAQIKALIQLLCVFEVIPLFSSSLRGDKKSRAQQ